MTCKFFLLTILISSSFINASCPYKNKIKKLPFNANQTATTTPVLVNKKLPFRLNIERADFELPQGVHSGARAILDTKWIFIAGRTNGLHGFNNNDNNFPPQQQNHNIYVLDTVTKKTISRSLNDPKSGLTQKQIDSLTVTSPQYYQNNNVLYITGGYGVDTKTGQFNTKDALTAIDLPGLIEWVISPNKNTRLIDSIRQINDPIFQVTGGYMYTNQKNLTLLIFGQNFEGFYNTNSNGVYTNQIRRFNIIDNGKKLSVVIQPSTPANQNYRRRDLNVVPVIRIENNKRKNGYVALSGVFTPGVNAGIWTVPVNITDDGIPSQADPNLASTFKQGMNNYDSAFAKLFSTAENNMYILLLGGLTFKYLQNGKFVTDSEIPFTNQITTIKIDKNGKYSQYLMDAQYPLIKSTKINPGSTLLFGTNAYFMPTNNVCSYFNFIYELDVIKKPQVIGYIVGGIQSTMLNTNTMADSGASPYIFKVTISPNK